DFAKGGVGFHGVVEERHEVFCAFGGVAERLEAAVNFGLGAIDAELFQAGGLAVGNGFVNLQNIQRFFFGNKIVHADDDFFLFVDSHLVAVGGFSYFALRVTSLDSSAHAAHRVDSVDVFPRATLDFVGERFDEVGAAEGVDGVGDAG